MKSRLVFFTPVVVLGIVGLTLLSTHAFVDGANAQPPVQAPIQFAPQPQDPHIAPDAATCAQFQGLMDAIEEDNYGDFLANADETVKGVLTKPMFESVVAQIAPGLKNGYSATYATQLRKNGFILSIWKIQFKQGDDMLGELSIKNGKVGGFFLR